VSEGLTKTCSKCKQAKLLEEFHRNKRAKDGHHTYCKECKNARQREYIAEDPERARSIDRRHRESPKGKERIDAYKRSERGKAMRRAWETSEKGKAVRALTNKNYNKRYPERRLAKYYLNRAVNKGQVMKPNACSECGATERIIDGHHDDYSKPLDVEWLCRGCHTKKRLKQEDG
jgi:hypothetical protein